MNPDIERLAKEAGAMMLFDVLANDMLYTSDLKILAEFAALIAEECAKEAEEHVWWAIDHAGPEDSPKNIAIAIRAKFALSNDKHEAK